MQINLEKLDIDIGSKRKIESLLSGAPSDRPDLEQMWYLMDKVWDEYGCDNKKLNMEHINQFYSHPVWMLNGLFIEQHELSMQHREAISSWIVDAGFQSVVDYGGGFGTLARLVASKNQNCNVEIFEPHSNDYTINSINELKNVKIVNQLGKYDCLISTDVLEHVPDPLLTFREMIDSVVSEGYLIIANNFNPVIKCHLPRTFHLRYTFNCFAKLMGLQDVGMLKGSHATIYVKKNVKPPKMCKIKIYEIISKTVYPVLRIVYPIVGRIKHLFAA